MSQGDSAIDTGGSQREEDSRAGRALHEFLRGGRSFSGRERNNCFLNTGGARFADISAVSGFDWPDDGRAIGVVDWDHDGDLDLWLANRSGPRRTRTCVMRWSGLR